MNIKNLAATLLLAGAAMTATAPAQARGVAVYSSGDTITHIADLKDADPQGKADLGWKHYQFALFWMPLWAGEGSYVLYEETSDGYTYGDLTEAEAMELAKASGVEASAPGPFELYWGWLVALGLIAVLVLMGRKKR